MTNAIGTFGFGIIFKVNIDGSRFTKLLDFDGANKGKNPLGTLILSNNVLYGMAESGGATSNGTAFKINTDGTGFFKFIDFDGINKGKFPFGDLTQSGDVFYGMTVDGGVFSRGVIFKYVFTSQTITFNPLPLKTFGDADFDPGAVATSGLPVAYSSSDTTVAKIVNNKVHIIKAGTSTIFADQAGNSSFGQAAKQSQSLLIQAFTPPTIPKGLTAVNAHFSKAILNWTANTETDIAAYKIYGHFDPNKLIATVNAPTTTFTDTSLINNTTYTYTISAVNTAGSESQKSAAVPVFIAFEPPVISSFSPAGGRVGSSVTISGLNFSPIPAFSKVLFGAVRAHVNTAGSNQLVVTVPAGATSQFISVTDSLSHLTGTSNRQFIVPDTTPPAIPKGLTAVNAHFSKAILTWTANNEGDISTYKIYGRFNPNNLVATVHTPVTSFTDTSLINDTTYTYRISAVDTAGNESLKSAPVPVFIAFEQAPVISSFSPAIGRVGVSVTISGLNFSHIPAFSKVLFGTVRAHINTASRTRLTVIVPPGAISQFISVTDSLSHLTGTSNTLFIVSDTIPPSVPRGLTAISAHFSKAVLNWTANSESDVAAYKIYGHFNPNNLVATVHVPITAFTDTSLINNIAYDYTISAIDTSGNESSKSTPVSVFIPFEPPVISSFAPSSGPVGTSVTITGLNFSTTPASNKVFFGATRAQVISASRNQLVVNVPSGATFQPISVTDSLSLLTGFSNNPFRTTFGPAGGQPLNSSSFGPNVNVGSNSIPSSVAISDLNGDGKPDLIVTNQGNNRVSLYRNISSNGTITAGSFATKVDFVTSTGPLKVIIADINGDGKPDLIIANSNNTVSVFKNTSSPATINTSSFTPRVNFNTFAGANSVASGDLDGDGKTDLVIGGGTGFSVLHNISSGGNLDSTSFERNVLFASASATNSVAIGDLDNDGKPDLAFTTAANTISIYKNTSVRGAITTSSFASAVNFAVGPGPRDVKMADLDGDGKPELATINFGGGTGTSASVLHNISSTGTITPGSFEPEVEFTTTVGSSSLAIGDVNGDGKPELATVANGSSSISVLLNTTSPGNINNNSFAPKIDFALAAGAVPNALVIGDLNADGKADLCAANITNNGILQNNLNATATPVIVGPPTGLSATPGNSEISLDWIANTESNVVAYKVYGGTSPRPRTLVATVIEPSYFNTGLTNGRTYYYRVSAVTNLGNESSSTPDISAVPTSFIQEFSVRIADSTTSVQPDVETMNNTNPKTETIRIYPNPSSGNVFIELPNADASSIAVMDMGTKVLKKGNYHQSLIILDIRNIANGFYFVRIKQGNILKTIKMEKM